MWGILYIHIPVFLHRLIPALNLDFSCTTLVGTSRFKYSLWNSSHRTWQLLLKFEEKDVVIKREPHIQSLEYMVGTWYLSSYFALGFMVVN